MKDINHAIKFLPSQKIQRFTYPITTPTSDSVGSTTDDVDLTLSDVGMTSDHVYWEKLLDSSTLLLRLVWLNHWIQTLNPVQTSPFFILLSKCENLLYITIYKTTKRNLRWVDCILTFVAMQNIQQMQNKSTLYSHPLQHLFNSLQNLQLLQFRMQTF